MTVCWPEHQEMGKMTWLAPFGLDRHGAQGTESPSQEGGRAGGEGERMRGIERVVFHFIYRK